MNLSRKAAKAQRKELIKSKSFAFSAALRDITQSPYYFIFQKKPIC
jgi:hypothetical protein